jgi:hypothetical protein
LAGLQTLNEIVSKDATAMPQLQGDLFTFTDLLNNPAFDNFTDADIIPSTLVSRTGRCFLARATPRGSAAIRAGEEASFVASLL